MILQLAMPAGGEGCYKNLALKACRVHVLPLEGLQLRFMGLKQTFVFWRHWVGFEVSVYQLEPIVSKRPFYKLDPDDI